MSSCFRKLQSCFSYFDQQQLRRDLDFGEDDDDDDESEAEGITIEFSKHNKDSEGHRDHSSNKGFDKVVTSSNSHLIQPANGNPT